MLSVMQNRSRDETKNMTLKQVNSKLDELVLQSFNNAGKIEIISELIASINLLELKWLTKLILKDLKLGIGHETLLKMYHPYALDLYNATSDLRAAFSQVQDYDAT
jgi:DNA ligase-4